MNLTALFGLLDSLLGLVGMLKLGKGGRDALATTDAVLDEIERGFLAEMKALRDELAAMKAAGRDPTPEEIATLRSKVRAQSELIQGVDLSSPD